MNHIFLIGMRGSGKTTVGKILSQKLKRPFLDTDVLIEQQAKKSISKIVKKRGWKDFRQLEKSVLGKVCAKFPRAIVATGGGIILDSDNRKLLKQHGTVFWLTAPVKTLVERISHDPNRPALTRKKSLPQELQFLIEKRQQAYQDSADHIISTNTHKIDTVTEKIVEKLISRAAVITGKTRVFGTIGNPVNHSLSPIIHNAAFKALGLDAVYLAFTAHSAKEAVNSIRSLSIKGVSVTIPHKITVLPFLDKLDKQAEKIGAVNTIINNNGQLTGHNTDVTGAIKALEEKVSLLRQRVLLLGAGGAARAIAFGLKNKQCDLTIANRTLETAKKLANEVGAKAIPLTQINKTFPCDIVINATSVGMSKSDQHLFEPKLLKQTRVVFDLVYTPLKTRLIKEARKQGCIVILGHRMLLFQAIDQFKLFTKKTPPIDIMERSLLKALEREK